MKLVVDNELSVKQTEALLVLIENDNPMESEDILETAKGINFLKLKARNKTSGPTKGINRAGARSGIEGLDSMSVTEALHSIRKRLPEIKEGASDWDAETADDALEIAMLLSEAVAELAIVAEAKKAKNKS